MAKGSCFPPWWPLYLFLMGIAARSMDVHHFCHDWMGKPILLILFLSECPSILRALLRFYYAMAHFLTLINACFFVTAVLDFDGIIHGKPYCWRVGTQRVKVAMKDKRASLPLSLSVRIHVKLFYVETLLLLASWILTSLLTLLSLDNAWEVVSMGCFITA